jgi:hypothetical protein
MRTADEVALAVYDAVNAALQPLKPKSIMDDWPTEEQAKPIVLDTIARAVEADRASRPAAPRSAETERAERIATELDTIARLAATPGEVDRCSIDVRYWLWAASKVLRASRPAAPAEVSELIARIEVQQAVINDQRRVSERLAADLARVTAERDRLRQHIADAGMAHFEVQESAAGRFGLKPGELQGQWRRGLRSDKSEIEWAIIDALAMGGIAAWPGDGVGCAAHIVLHQMSRAEAAEARLADAEKQIIDLGARAVFAEGEVADAAKRGAIRGMERAAGLLRDRAGRVRYAPLRRFSDGEPDPGARFVANVLDAAVKDIEDHAEELRALTPQSGPAPEPEGAGATRVSGTLRDDPTPEWQPIETAPNIDEVLVYCPDTGEQFVGYMNGDRDVGGFVFALGRDGEPIVCMPTHWRPLPAPPFPARPAQEGGA